MKVQDWKRDLQTKKELRVWERQGKNKCTVEPRFNEPLYNEVIDLTNDFLIPIIVRYMKKNLDITKPRYNEQILSVP